MKSDLILGRGLSELNEIFYELSFGNQHPTDLLMGGSAATRLIEYIRKINLRAVGAEVVDFPLRFNGCKVEVDSSIPLNACLLKNVNHPNDPRFNAFFYWGEKP